jgi:hypothetical protein
MSFPSNTTLTSLHSNATSAGNLGNQQQQWRHGVPLNLIRRDRDSELEFGDQHRTQQLLEKEEIRHGQQRYGVQTKQAYSQRGADLQRVRTVSHGRMEKAQSGRSQCHTVKDSEVQSGPCQDHTGAASQPQQQQIRSGADPQQAHSAQIRSGADPHIHSGLGQVIGRDPNSQAIHGQNGMDSGAQSGSSKGLVGADSLVQSEHGGGQVDSAHHREYWTPFSFFPWVIFLHWRGNSVLSLY